MNVIPPGHDAVGLCRISEAVPAVDCVVVHTGVRGVSVHPLESLAPVVIERNVGDVAPGIAEVCSGRCSGEGSGEEDGQGNGGDLRQGKCFPLPRCPEGCDCLFEPVTERPCGEDRRKEREVILEPQVLDGCDEDDD